MLQTSPLLILPLTAILYRAAIEQPDVTSHQLNSLALVYNWSIMHAHPWHIVLYYIPHVPVWHLNLSSSRFTFQMFSHQGLP